MKYTTPNGKIVFGGGGISPDVFVAIDTSKFHNDINQLIRKGILREFTFIYTEQLRQELLLMGIKNFIEKFEIDKLTLKELKLYCEKQKQQFELNNFNNNDLKILKTQLKAQVGRNIWNDDAFFPVINEIDNTFQRALNY